MSNWCAPLYVAAADREGELAERLHLMPPKAREEEHVPFLENDRARFGSRQRSEAGEALLGGVDGG